MPQTSFDWQKKFRVFDFVERVSMAVLRCKGVFIDFGTTDYFKYVLGKWHAGWGQDATLRDWQRDFTQAIGKESRVFFPWYYRSGAVLKIKLKPQRAVSVSVYVNNRPVGKINFRNGWSSYDLLIKKGFLFEEENELVLKWKSNSELSNEDVAADVDYIYFVKKGEETHFLPIQKSFFSKETLILHANSALSYYLQIPDKKLKPELRFNLKTAGDFIVRITDDNKKAVQFSICSFGDYSLDLNDFSNQVVRIDIENNSSHKLIVSKLGIYTEPLVISAKRDGKIAKNVIFIMIDTLRADHTNCYGGETKTPVLDRLAKEGTLFERFSAAEDWTNPSCATMLTGLYPLTHKAQTEDAILSPDAPMISEELQNNGFATAAFISNSYISEGFGFKRGWDYYKNFLKDEELTEAANVFMNAMFWIEKNRERRFFAYIHTIDPHAPYSPPESFLRMYDPNPYNGPIKPQKTHIQLEDIKAGRLKVDRRDIERMVALYDGEISYHDKWLGVFMQKLEEMGILEDTLIIVTADHGEEFWEHGGLAHGHSIYQELIHVPFIIYWKGTVPKDLRIADNYDHSVIVPTIFDALGLEPPDYLEGNSILPKIFGQNDVLPHAGFSSHKDERMGVWSNNWKFQINEFEGRLSNFLFNLEKDPGCHSNIHKKHPITLRYMKTLLGMFMGAQDKRFWKSSKLIKKKKKLKLRMKKLEWDDELRRQLES